MIEKRENKKKANGRKFDKNYFESIYRVILISVCKINCENVNKFYKKCQIKKKKKL